jgi:hypothetical protein
MGWDDKLPTDYRVTVAIAVLTVLALVGLRTWMVGIAEAAVEPTKDTVTTIAPKVDALYLACVARGECKPPEIRP